MRVGSVYLGGVAVAGALAIILVASQPVQAEWTTKSESNFYYTDDVALFSATRRLSRAQDPTQPVVDEEVAEQGDDVVYEPVAQLANSFKLGGRDTEVLVRGQGFVFASNARFNHGTLGVQARHEVTPATKLVLRYFFSPDLLLGKNTERRTGLELKRNERVTTNYWAAGLTRDLSDEFSVALFTRYGIRRYNDAFKQRDTDFCTVGTHLEFELPHGMELMLGYHYERGLAEGRKDPEFENDVSYVNHFVTSEFTIELLDPLSLEMAMHYERNDWTTGIVGDERKGGARGLGPRRYRAGVSVP